MFDIIRRGKNQRHIKIRKFDEEKKEHNEQSKPLEKLPREKIALNKTNMPPRHFL